MFTIQNLLKTLLIASIIAFAWVFYESTTVFQQNANIQGNTSIGRIEAFMGVLEMMEPWHFWSHLLKQWLLFFSMLFIGCATLLMVIKPPNKKRNEMEGSDEPSIR